MGEVGEKDGDDGLKEGDVGPYRLMPPPSIRGEVGEYPMLGDVGE
jgi:hypothetical protein